jgi:monoamine oxidase
MVLGGYGLLANGLASMPTPLDIRFNTCINKISLAQTQNRRTPDIDEAPITITCIDGGRIEADAVVVSVSLGVLKSEAITFEPELPDRKKEAISRLGFGLLNKVLVSMMF